MKAVTDGIRRLDGVADVGVDLQANLCTVTPTPDRLFDLRGIPAAVRASGYTPARMWIEAHGSIADREGGKWFTVSGTALVVRVNGESPDDGVLTGELTIGDRMVVVPGPSPR